MNIYLDPSYILHQRPYKETSLILEIFSLNYGRVSLIAKGVKGRKNTQRQLLQPARKVNISWNIRTEIGSLIKVEENGMYKKLDGRWLLSTFYLNELLFRMLHRHESHPELFNIYDISLSNLYLRENEEKILRKFEKHLLTSLGYGLILDHDFSTGKAIDKNTDYYYQLNHGPCLNKPGSSKYVQVSGQTLIALTDEKQWNERIAKESKKLMRLVLNEYMGGKPLGSRNLYEAYLNNHTAQ